MKRLERNVSQPRAKGPGLSLTIKEAIIRVLQEEHCGMTIEQIYYKIIANGWYSFGAKKPQNVIRVEIDRACENTNYTVRAAKDYFRFERNPKGEKVYFLLSSTQDNKSTPANNVACSEVAEPEQVDYKTIVIWNDSIKRSFQIWMESMNYSPATIRNYYNAIERTFHNFKSILNIAVNETSTEHEAVGKFVELLFHDREFIETNRTGHNMYSAAFKAYKRFIYKDITDDSSGEKAVSNNGLKDIVDLEEGKKGLSDILGTHFLTLNGYSNIGILWSASQNSLSMFLNDNGINSENDLWHFLVRAFKNDYVFNSPHIWQNQPDYPQTSKGLIINLARQHNGVVTREQIDNFFSQIKLTSLNNSLVLDKDQLIFHDKAKFMLIETLEPNSYRCSLIAKALKTLFSTEETPYIILRDIKTSWFSSLPGLPNGLQWTPLLLQEILRIRPGIGYKVIFPSLKKQALDTVGAVVVPAKSRFNTFADVVHQFCFCEYKLPCKLYAEELRTKLREVGMIEGNELIWNMHKALKDYRFAFSDQNLTVMILEK